VTACSTDNDDAPCRTPDRPRSLRCKELVKPNRILTHQAPISLSSRLHATTSFECSGCSGVALGKQGLATTLHSYIALLRFQSANELGRRTSIFNLQQLLQLSIGRVSPVAPRGLQLLAGGSLID
jgi:hypothetical protein